IMVGGGAVNFHGYQRHSADVDFWIDTRIENLNNLRSVFWEMGYDLSDFPKDVKAQNQNISIKFSPLDLDIELITRFNIGKSFEEVYSQSIVAEVNKPPLLRWRVLNLQDLITSKIKAARPKDLLDIQQLKEIHKH
ncbi:MAG: nucleotidyl transferase AbiEii/AbiGii toxin family protein, partial [Cyclobacteriaceae bacterium]